jgi:protein-S-isoprenylcysteine O-methyltransferase Ste14
MVACIRGRQLNPIIEERLYILAGPCSMKKGLPLELGSAVASRLKALRRTKLYDLFAAAPLIAWYALCAAHMLPSVVQQIALAWLFVQTDPSFLPVSLILSIVSQIGALVFVTVLVVMFAVRHVPQRGTVGTYPRCAAVAGTFLGVGILLLPPQELSSGLYLVSLLLIIGGTVFAIFAVLVLGRSVSILPEARRLVTRGPYALVRHPLYLGEMTALAGVALQYFSPWTLLLLGLQWSFQLQRMKNEERVLFQVFPEYENYMARTARLIPWVY